MKTKQNRSNAPMQNKTNKKADKMKMTELAGIAAQLEQDFKSGAIFLYDIATERVIAEESIDTVKLNEYGTPQINLNGKWLFCDARLKAKLPEQSPHMVVRAGPDDAGVSKRVVQIRDMLHTEQVVILDRLTGYLVPASMICGVDANGTAVQISLCPKWHMGRQDYRCECFSSPESSDEDLDEEMEDQMPTKKIQKGAKAKKQVAER